MARSAPTARSRSSRQPRSSRRSRSAGRRAGRPHRTGSRTRRTPTRRAAPHQREVQAFLERFTVCLTAGDGDGVTHCFELPALMIMSDPKHGKTQVLDDPQKVSGFFTQAPEQYNEKGIETTFPEIERLEWLDDALGLVQVRFPYVDGDGNDLGDGESSLYVLRRDQNGELAILTAVALGTDADRKARRGKGRNRPVGHEGDQLA